jgi:hypothetical protein
VVAAGPVEDESRPVSSDVEQAATTIVAPSAKNVRREMGTRFKALMV